MISSVLNAQHCDQKKLQERVSPQPHYVAGETKMNKSQLIQSLNCELEELRQEVVRRRRGRTKYFFNFLNIFNF